MTALAVRDAVPNDDLLEAGFAFLEGDATRNWFEHHGTLTDWDAFAASWNGMATDTYMADGGRYRRRRHAVFAAGPDGIVRRPDQPHFQTTEYNNLNGGVARWFEPVPAEVVASTSLQTILASCHASFDDLAASRGKPVADWHVEIHQFRIEAKADEQGQPTPEGLHRDGVDYVLVLMIGRDNIASGTTTIHGLDRAELGSFTLTRPLDAALVDDRRVYHGVTAVVPVDAAQPAHRDVLVVTFRSAD